MVKKVRKSAEEWKAELSPDIFRITRLSGTEPAFTGEYYNHKAPGVYRCVCCGEPLFNSREKFDSGSGWPSFWSPTEAGAVEARPDNSLGMARTEVRCAACEAHLGHVFEDGPEPTGLRYCINSGALQFDKKDES